MTELEIKKKRFKALIKGKYIPSYISIKEAKQKLKQTDPGIDISELIKIINSKNKDEILKNLLIEIATNPDILTYYMPVIKTILKTFIK